MPKTNEGSRKLERLEAGLVTAINRMSAAMMVEWPVGKQVWVFLNSRQTKASGAEVVGYDAKNGTVRVRLFKINSRGCRHVCNVHWKRCM